METMPYIASESGAKLVILEMGKIKSCPLDVRKHWTLGRTCPGNSPDIPLQSPIAGRKQGEFLYIDGQWFYVDGKSTNGTFYNSKKIRTGLNGKVSPIPLNNGDVLRVDYQDLRTPDANGVWMLFVTDSVFDTWLVYPLNKKATTVIGRDATCDIVQDCSYISSKHAKITYLNGNYYVSDCDSTAGTWLNTKKITTSTMLQEKDKISLCDCHFIFTGNSLLYNKREKYSTRQTGNVVLKANIQTKKVSNNSGFGKKELLRNIQLEIKEGSLVALLGGSGAGKSTLIQCLNGTGQQGVVGTVSFYGENLYENFERLKYLIGNVSQKNVVHPMLTVKEELKEAAELRLPRDTKKAEIQQRVDDMIHILGLEKVKDSKIKKLSGGEEKRVHIGIDLISDAKLLCMDEPDAGLDPATKREMLLILKKLAKEQGKCIITIIHDVSDIDLFDQVIMLAKVDNVGRLAFNGTPKEATNYFKMELAQAYKELKKNPEKYVKG